jgi:hypothetical protein
MADFILHTMKPIPHRKSFVHCLVVFGFALSLLYFFLLRPFGVGDLFYYTGFLKSVLIHASSMGDMLFSVGFFIFLYLFFRERVDLPSLVCSVLFTQLAVQLIKNATHDGGWILFQERLHPGFEQSPFISSYAANTGVLFGWLFFQCRSIWFRIGFLLLFMGSILSRYILLSPDPASLLLGGIVGLSVLLITFLLRHSMVATQSKTVSIDQPDACCDLDHALTV